MLGLARATLKKVPGFSSSSPSKEKGRPTSNPSNGSVNEISSNLANMDVSATAATPTLPADLQGGVAKVTNDSEFWDHLGRSNPSLLVIWSY